MSADLLRQLDALIVAAEARGGVLLPVDQRVWPRALHRDCQSRLAQILDDGRVSGREAERRAAMAAAVAWLRSQHGSG